MEEDPEKMTGKGGQIKRAGGQSHPLNQEPTAAQMPLIHPRTGHLLEGSPLFTPAWGCCF